MKLTKYMHACLVLEKDGRSIVIDPGSFSDDFAVPKNVVAVVVTHQHPDHCDPNKLRAIVERNPDAVVYALAEVAHIVGVPVGSIYPGDTRRIGGFHLEFTGGRHATIHEDLDEVGNIGVIVDHDVLYYPGDSFTLPPRPMRYTAVPVAAPWLKISEAVEFLRTSAPSQAFPTHDAILSDKGQVLVDRVVAGLLNKPVVYTRIENGKTIEL